jgi:hypothetical protein
MQELIIVTNKKVVIAIPVTDLIKLSDGDRVAGVSLIDIEPTKPEEK